MLLEIKSNKLRKGAIAFHSGLNVVLGDDNATNSIGKSSLLMIVDFAFGGDSLVEHNTDIVSELGHHDYYFTFSFEGQELRFCRGTARPELVYRCSTDYVLQDSIDIEVYRGLLKARYLGGKAQTFRSLVGLYSRVWGKTNLDVHHPLHAVPAQRAKDCVDNLIRAFDLYGPIATLAAELQKATTEQNDLKRAFRSNIVPKVGKREYKENADRIAVMEEELKDIKQNLAAFALNISAIANKDMLELKNQKDRLLAVKLQVETRLSRVRRSLSDSKYVRSSHFEALQSFFPDLNANRLANIETFHSSLAKILKAELQETEATLQGQLEGANDGLAEIDEKLTKRLGVLDAPSVVVDRVFDVSSRLRQAREQNHFYERMEALTGQLLEKESDLSQKKQVAIKKVEDEVNRQMRGLVSATFGEMHKSPHLTLQENNYAFDTFEDTGTGTAYASLIVFDLAVFLLTNLPFVIHDSLLYKNIENDAVARLLSIYEKASKQSFIAIDEVGKYGAAVASSLRTLAVVQLDNNNVLFIKDWRKT